MNHQDSLAKTSKELMLKEPFYGLFLISLNKIWSDKVPTAGVAKNNINYQLVINPEFWGSLSDPHKLGLLKHELLHIAFFHICSEHPGYDKKLSNIAMDLEINQYIDGINLPDGGCTIKTDPFVQLNLPEKVGWHTYYDLIKNELDNNPDSESSQRIQQMMDDQGSGQSHTQMGDMIPDHESWGEFENLSDAEKKLIEKQTEHVLSEIKEQVEKSRGNIPGELKSILERLNVKEPPKFDWKGYLRRFTGGSQKVYTKKLRRKFNKRFEENPGLKIKQRRHILVAIDTSGSVSDKELKEFFHEIDHINKTGSDITVIQCDTSISYIGEYRRGQELVVHGRGGTSFDPVLEYYNANTGKYTCLVYLTDGECDTDINVKGKMLWVISTRGSINKSLKGPQIKLN
jgi:predicted metal-dependent peptidase